MSTPTSLGFLDSAVLAGYVGILAAIGWWAARRAAHNTEDYFLASRSIPWLVTAASFLTTCISALTFIGTPSVGYGGDYRYLFSNIGDICASIFVATCFLPIYQRLKITSIYEVIALRLGNSVRTVCAAYFLLSRTLASTVRIVAIAKVLEVVTGGALSYEKCVVVVICVILSYTTLGGGRAIAWTDLVQFILLISGALIALTYLVWNTPGGVAGIIAEGSRAVKPDGTIYTKFNFLDLSPQHLKVLFLMCVWGFFQSTSAYGADQDMVQRLLACNDPKRARWSLMLSGLAGIPINFLFLTIGVALYAYSRSHPALIAGMTDNDHVFPRFILTTLPPGLRGLLLAAVASAAMGSSDSAIASLATAFTIDFYRPFWGKNATEAQALRFSKLSYLFFGFLFLVFALLLHNMDDLLWLAFRVVGFTYGPLLGVFLVALLTEWRVPAKRLIALMLSYTSLSFALAMVANYTTQPNQLPDFLPASFVTSFKAFVASGGPLVSFLVAMHRDYWQVYIMLGALVVPACCYFWREK